MRHIFTPELCIKATLYVHTVTSHCVSCKHAEQLPELYVSCFVLV